MGMFALAGVVFCAAAAVAIHGWRARDESTHFVLRLLPPALLFVSMPAMLGAWRTTSGFQDIATTGTGGLQEAGRLSVAIAEPLLVGLLGLILAASAAAGLQAFATGVTGPPEEPSAPADRLEIWLLLFSSMFILPTAYAAYLVRGVATLVMAAAVDLSGPPDAVAAPAGMSMDDLTALLARRLLTVGVVGGLTNLGLIALTAALLTLARSRHERGRLGRYSWTVFAVVVSAAASGAYIVAADIRAFNVILRTH